ncbi:MAG TPA: hypothetical protein VN541_03250, partial [Tepidisphaeraceae bacterium]|nr:hypothetical protein [Tepidisphaeraceae bacterium]
MNFNTKKLMTAAAVIALIAYGASAKAGDVAAISARDFLDSLGVCTHIGQGADDPERAADALTYAGIRNIRDDASPRHVRDWILVHKQAGVKVVLTQSGPSDSSIPRILAMSRHLAEVGALLALEGPNEPNNWAVTWHGQKSGKTFMPVAQWQSAFYAAAKRDGVL